MSKLANSAMFLPFTLKYKDSFLSLAPSQTGHSTLSM